MKTGILSFWGKGGVGKTTLSLSATLGLIKDGAAESILYVSSDPITSLHQRVQRRIKGIDVLQLSIPVARKMWKERFGDEVYSLLSSFLPVERDIVDYIAGAPGIVDEFLLYLVLESYKKAEYDYIIWDTTAAYGSLRLVQIEEEFYEHLSNAVKMYFRLKGFLERLRKGGREPLGLIEEWKRIAREILSMLASKDHKAFLISISEPLGLYTTKLVYQEMKEASVSIEKVIINMLIRESLCPECHIIREKSRQQTKVLKEFKNLYEKEPGICIIPYLGEAIDTPTKLYNFYKNWLKECLKVDDLR
jgi:arsenite-transporting ATPase